LLGISLRKLAIVQIILGLLVIGSFFAFNSWIYDGYYTYEGTIPGSDITVRMLQKPHPFIPGNIEVWQFVLLGLGVIVVVLGIIQFIKSRY
jgi:hypothetical protein